MKKKKEKGIKLTLFETSIFTLVFGGVNLGFILLFVFIINFFSIKIYESFFNMVILIGLTLTFFQLVSAYRKFY